MGMCWPPGRGCEGTLKACRELTRVWAKPCLQPPGASVVRAWATVLPSLVPRAGRQLPPQSCLVPLLWKVVTAHTPVPDSWAVWLIWQSSQTSTAASLVVTWCGRRPVLSP